MQNKKAQTKRERNNNKRNYIHGINGWLRDKKCKLEKYFFLRAELKKFSELFDLSFIK